jgi:hypothetical protein
MPIDEDATNQHLLDDFLVNTAQSPIPWLVIGLLWWWWSSWWRLWRMLLLFQSITIQNLLSNWGLKWPSKRMSMDRRRPHYGYPYYYYLGDPKQHSCFESLQEACFIIDVLAGSNRTTTITTLVFIKECRLVYCSLVLGE